MTLFKLSTQVLLLDGNILFDPRPQEKTEIHSAFKQLLKGVGFHV